MGNGNDNDDDNMCHDTIHRYLMIGKMHGQKAGDWARSLHDPVHGYDMMKTRISQEDALCGKHLVW